MSKKVFSLDRKKYKSKKISMFAMISIAILAIFSFTNITSNYVGMGLSASVAFAIAVIVFLFPFIFMIAEFASLKKSSKSGLTSWIHIAIGRKVAFLTSFMFWFANLTYFFGAIPGSLNLLTFGLTGKDYTNNEVFKLIIPFACVIFFGIITAISTLNTKKLAKLFSFSGLLILIITGFFFAMAIIGWIIGAIDSSLLHPGMEAPGLVPNDELNKWGDAGGMNFAWISIFIWVLMAADGGQTLGVYVENVKGGRKTFTKSMIYSVCIIGGMYIFGTFLVSVFPPEGGLALSSVDSFAKVFYLILHPMGVSPDTIIKISYVTIGLVFFATGLGGLLIWTSAPVKVMFSEISPGVFGSNFTKQNKNGVCSFGSWLQFFLVIPFLFLLTFPMEGGSFSDNLSTIRSAAGWIGMLPWVIIFLSYTNLRLNRDYEQRSFRMGNRKFGITIGIFLTIISVAILVLTFLDTAPLNEPYHTWDANWWIGPFMKIVMVGVILVPAYSWYYFKFEFQYRDTKMSLKHNLPTKYALIKYSFTNKFVFWCKPWLYQNYIKSKNKLLLEAKNNISKLIDKEDIEEKIKIDASIKLENLLKHKTKDYYLRKVEILKINKDASNRIKKVKERVRQEKERVRQEIILLKRKYQESVRIHAHKLRMETRSFYKNKMNPLILKYKNNSNIKQLLLLELPTTSEKDIKWNAQNKNMYKNYNSYSAASYYWNSQIKLDDKIIMNNDSMIIIRNYAGELIAQKISIKNIKLFKEGIDKDVQIILSGEEKQLGLVSVIHVENNQFEDFKIYVENIDEFVADFNKNQNISVV